MELPQFEKILLQALPYPEIAQPEFFIKEQEKSGWSKNFFLLGLNEAYRHYTTKLSIATSKQVRKLEKEGIDKDGIEVNLKSFGLDLEKETEGKQKGQLTKEMLDELYYSIKYASKWGQTAPSYKSLEVLAFVERGLEFIKSEFDKQLNKEAKLFRLSGTNSKYELFYYNIIANAPLFDYIRYKYEVRNLLLNSTNKDELITILTPVSELAKKIVDLWNNELYPLEHSIKPVQEDEISETNLLLEFDESEMTFSTMINFTHKDLWRESSKGYSNQQFAKFAVSVVNLINLEVLKKTNEPNIEAKQPSIENFLFPLKSAFNSDKDYLKAVELVTAFFSSQPIKIKSALFVKNKNTKELAFALGNIWKTKKNSVITYEYLQFYKEAFTIFKDQVLDKSNILGSNLYKYSMSKT